MGSHTFSFSFLRCRTFYHRITSMKFVLLKKYLPLAFVQLCGWQSVLNRKCADGHNSWRRWQRQHFVCPVLSLMLEKRLSSGWDVILHNFNARFDFKGNEETIMKIDYWYMYYHELIYIPFFSMILLVLLSCLVKILFFFFFFLLKIV